MTTSMKQTAKAALHISRRNPVMTTDELLARCVVDPVTRCWVWQAGCSKGRPCIYTFDYLRGEKKRMSGALAAWHIAHNSPPSRGALVYRCCVGESSKLCVNPAHLRQAYSRAEANAIAGRSGRLKGLHSTGRLQALETARQVRGTNVVPAEAVRAIRAAPEGMSNLELARLYGCHHSTASMIRRGLSRAGVV